MILSKALATWNWPQEYLRCREELLSQIFLFSPGPPFIFLSSQYLLVLSGDMSFIWNACSMRAGNFVHCGSPLQTNLILARQMGLPMHAYPPLHPPSGPHTYQVVIVATYGPKVAWSNPWLQADWAGMVIWALSRTVLNYCPWLFPIGETKGLAPGMLFNPPFPSTIPRRPSQQRIIHSSVNSARAEKSCPRARGMY